MLILWQDQQNFHRITQRQLKIIRGKQIKNKIRSGKSDKHKKAQFYKHSK